MDCKDLMVKDLVYVVRGYDKHLTIEKVKGVIADKDEPYPVTIFTGETVSLNDIKPIPLTEEILEKNGFDFTKRDYGVCCEEDKYGDVELSKDKNGFYLSINTDEYEILRIDYVHTLQHLLRLCGVEKELVID